MSGPLNFGVFVTPFHPVGQSPTVALEYDLERVVALDRLGYDEAWFGEHHSGGYELIACPEVFIATAAERTKHIQLGTGVVSLPYHHPLMVADRWVLLDHLTPGRTTTDDAGVAGGDSRAVPRRARGTDQPALGLVHAARCPAAHPPVHLALPRNLHCGNDLPVRAAARGPARHLAAVSVDVRAGRLRGAREHLGGGSRAGQEVRSRRAGPAGLACARHRAPRRFPRGGGR